MFLLALNVVTHGWGPNISHRSGGDSVIHTEVYIVGHTLSHGIDVLSMWLAQCIPVCSLKATGLLQLPVTIFSQFSLQVASEQGAYISSREKKRLLSHLPREGLALDMYESLTFA
ncbi:hypothetical protein ATANTOWER_014204 [Ataeniobius toweri]|uniref:Uncharacterized protein n=1 Tax=Ataeniobius toweri TaxID=208326 RepID=A0ABU7BG66_9TELE|nr:hypothetical protein [Ataeniobius toweri]